MDEYLQFAVELATEAGRIMRNYYANKPGVETKEDDTIVTVADTEINAMVIDKVSRRFPDHSVDGEEASHTQDSDHVWVCDPIDGTNPFAMELPVSVFSLALVINGEPQLGVVYDPHGDRLYRAVMGGGAYMNDEPIKVSNLGLTKEARINFDWWPNAELEIISPLVKMSKETGVYMLSPGSTTHMAALVARGAFVASIFAGTKGKNMDIAAAKVIVEEAGGKVTDILGYDQRYDGDINGAIVSNGIVHDELVQYFKEGLR